MKRLVFLFSLFVLAAPVMTAVASESQPSLHLRAGSFDPASPRALSLSLQHPTHYSIVQFAGPIRSEWKNAVVSAGSRILDYIPDYAFVCKTTDASAQAIAQLSFVRAIAPYLPAYKIDPAFAKATGSVSATASLFGDADASAFLASARSAGLTAQASGDFISLSGDAKAIQSLVDVEGVRWIEVNSRLKFMDKNDRSVLGLTQVWQNYGIYGEDQIVGIMDTGLDLGTKQTVNLDFQGRVLDGMGLNTADDWADRYGHGTHVAGIMIGSGILSGGDPVLKKFDRSYAGIAPLASIVVQEVDVDPTTGKSQGLDASTDLGPILDWAYQKGARIHNDSWGDDDSPDGTYTLHSAQVDKYVWEHPDFLPFFAAGNSGTDGEYQKAYLEANYKLIEALSDSGVNASNSSELISAIASCYLGDTSDGGSSDLSCLLSDDPDACELTGDSSSDTTGSTDSSSSTDLCQILSDIETLQTEAQENSKGKIDPGSINSPGTAKNVVTVGASEGNMLSTDADYKCTDEDTSSLDMMEIYLQMLGGSSSGMTSSQSYCTYQAVGYPEDPFASDDMSDNVNGIAAFSSRGPTLDGRIKPDLVAPGTRIISNNSALGQSSAYWATVNSNAHYSFAGGTSQSTPMAAGSAILVREWLQKNQGQSTPSAALIKALMMNDAQDIYPGQYGEGNAHQEIDTTRPNSVEGWGRVNLASIISPTSPEATLFVDEKTGLHTGDAKSYSYQVKAGTPLAITVAWSDYPADPTAAISLVNDLDLTVTGPDGKAILGNGAADRFNNVETVDVAAPVDGDYVVKVAGYNVPMGPQPFALAVSGSATAVTSSTVAVKGDLNGDGKLTISDVTLALRAAVGMIDLTSDQLNAADVSPADQPDGKITVTDVTRLLQAAMGLISL